MRRVLPFLLPGYWWATNPSLGETDMVFLFLGKNPCVQNSGPSSVLTTISRKIFLR